MKKLSYILSALLLCTALFTLPATAADDITFTDVKAQTEEFMGYYGSIQLTDEQEAVKKAALVELPAPCCSNNTAYTCCCPCNLSRSIWGLSNFLITEKGADAEAVRTKVSEWIEFVNPDGFSGDVCYSGGGCMRPFEGNGCGGMNPTRVSWPDATTGGR